MDPNNQEINQIEICLRKAIIVCKLRDTLTKFGISEEESVMVSLKSAEEVLASVEIEAIARKNILKRGEMSLKDLRDFLRDDFFNPAQIMFGLLDQVATSDQSINSDQTITLNIQGGSPELNFNLSFAFGCRPCFPFGWCTI